MARTAQMGKEKRQTIITLRHEGQSFSAATSDPGQQHQCKSIASVPLLAPTCAQTRDPLHTDNSHPRSTVTHRATKAAALAEQGEQLLQGLGAIETLLARTPLTS